MLGSILSSLVEILKEVVVIIVIYILIVVIINSWLDGKEIEGTVKCFGKEIVSFSRKWNKKEKIILVGSAILGFAISFLIQVVLSSLGA